MLNDEQLIRYSRQILLADIDIAGQQRLLGAHVLVIGAGGLGSPVALYLAGAGVGHLTLADGDRVELSNLHRQIAHTHAAIGRNKAVSASTTARAINPDITIDCLESYVDEAALQTYLKKHAVDVVVDASDNFATRHAINRACLAAKIALVSGAAIRMEGQLSVFDARRDDSPCYACLYAEDGASDERRCSDAGVLGPVVGAIASLQAIETLKLLLDIGDKLVGRLLLFDGKAMEWRSLQLKKDPHCPVCTQKTPSHRA